MNEKRSRIVVKRRFQHNMALVVTLALFVTVNVLFVIGYLVIDSVAELHAIKRTMAYALAIAEPLALGLIYWLGLKESHRIAGPLFVLERALGQVRDGRLDIEMRLRAGDHFHETRDAFNAMREDLSRRIGASRKLAEALAQQLPEGSEERARARQLAAMLAHYHTGDEEERS